MRYSLVRFTHVIASVLAVGWLVGCSSSSTPAPADAPKPVAAPKETAGGATRPVDRPSSGEASSEPKTVAAFLTWCGPTPYRSLRYFEKQSVPFTDMPGAQDVAARIALFGQPIPKEVIVRDSLFEVCLDNLGLVTRTLTSYRAYIEPASGHIVAFDLVSTSGGVPRRVVGHRTKNGCHVAFRHGAKQEEEKDIEFPPGTEILPLSLDFVHLYFLRYKDRKELVRSFFVPEIIGFSELTATPEGTEMVALGGRNYECAKYLVRTGSSRAREGVTARQYLWFDVQRATLIKRVDVQSREGFESVVERVEPERLETLAALIVRPAKMAVERAFPYPLDQELAYRVRMGDQTLGTIRVTFSKQVADGNGPEGWRSRAFVNLSTKSEQGMNERQEEAVTRFDAHFRPLEYLATGRESAGARAEYTIHARFADGSVALRVRRETRPLVRGDPSASPGGTEPTNAAPDWDEPLRRISLAGDGEDADVTPQRVQNERYVRPLSDGVFPFDYHRVEHLAAALYRLPLPERPKEAGKALPMVRQSVAFYGVRQNMSALVSFAVSPEPRTDPADPRTSECYEVKTANLLMPGRMLMDGAGRLLQWSTRCGTQDIVYTLDDPIMHERERRLERTPAQEGPLLLRPPWY